MARSSFKATIKTEGLEDVRAGLARGSKGMMRTMLAELGRQNVLTLSEAVTRAPIKFGFLRKNVIALKAIVIRSKRGAKGRSIPAMLRAAFVFRQKYAEAQHETLFFRHREGEAKYAENALKARSRAIIGGLARAGRRFLAGGGR